jgi:hypothetical protein
VCQRRRKVQRSDAAKLQLIGHLDEWHDVFEQYLFRWILRGHLCLRCPTVQWRPAAKLLHKRDLGEQRIGVRRKRQNLRHQ